ncbi:MAG TPA: hypothetical protein VND93_14005 [Myxococcales bacterium]|nr:hypothetical protein [Myxococcales bacterium]
MPEPIPPGGLILEGERAKVELENSCFERLNWRCTLRALPAGSGQAASLVPALVARGYTEVKRVPSLLEAFHPDGHRVAVVPSTGRIQIRVSMKVPEQERAKVALELAEELGQVAEGAGP